MASARTHAVVGAIAAVAPDIALPLFAWRRRWLNEDERVIRAHRWLHSWRGLLWIAVAAWWSHVLLDYVSKHNKRVTF